MENVQQVYVNTFAEGALVTEPQDITKDNLQMVVRNWKKGATVAHFHFFGLESVRQGETRKDFLVGDIGAAKVMLPLDQEYSGLTSGQDPKALAGLWLSCVVEDFDFQDEANPVVVLNRKKALERMQVLNQRRVTVGAEATAVVQEKRYHGTSLSSYKVNVAGYEAFLPRAYYDWDFDAEAQVGEVFTVKVLEGKNGVLTVSRKELLPNPMSDAVSRIKRGMQVRVKVSHIHNGQPKGEIFPGVKVAINPANMRQVINVGDEVFVRVLGNNDREFFGIVAS